LIAGVEKNGGSALRTRRNILAEWTGEDGILGGKCGVGWKKWPGVGVVR